MRINWLLIVISATTFSSSYSLARLGASAESKQMNANLKQARIAMKSSGNAAYTVQEIQASGHTMNEYINKEGVVFALSWSGATRPDLATYLGDYYSEFRASEEAQAKATKRLSRSTSVLTVTTAHVVVRKEGHMRDMHGFAYAPSLVPAGVSVEDLK